MHSYLFQEGNFPTRFSKKVETTLFHDAKHLRLQGEQWLHFVIVEQQPQEVVAYFPVHISASQASSPARSPFGSIILDEALPESLISGFIEFVESSLRGHAVESWHVIQYPEAYFPKHAEICKRAFERCDFVVTTVMSAVQLVTPESFETRLHYSERKRLRKAIEAGLYCKQLSIDNLESIYDFLYACRNSKGYTLSMSKQACTRLRDTFPDHVLLFGCFDGKKLIAAAFVIKVCHDILYDFYHDHDANYDNLSPVVLLNSYMYKVCQQENMRLFDLGTSMLGDTINQPLLNFKLKLGAILSPKYIFTKHLTTL